MRVTPIGLLSVDIAGVDTSQYLIYFHHDLSTPAMSTDSSQVGVTLFPSCECRIEPLGSISYGVSQLVIWLCLWHHACNKRTLW